MKKSAPALLICAALLTGCGSSGRDNSKKFNSVLQKAGFSDTAENGSEQSVNEQQNNDQSNNDWQNGQSNNDWQNDQSNNDWQNDQSNNDWQNGQNNNDWQNNQYNNDRQNNQYNNDWQNGQSNNDWQNGQSNNDWQNNQYNNDWQNNQYDQNNGDGYPQTSHGGSDEAAEEYIEKLSDGDIDDSVCEMLLPAEYSDPRKSDNTWKDVKEKYSAAIGQKKIDPDSLEKGEQLTYQQLEGAKEYFSELCGGSVNVNISEGYEYTCDSEIEINGKAVTQKVIFCTLYLDGEGWKIAMTTADILN